MVRRGAVGLVGLVVFVTILVGYGGFGDVTVPEIGPFDDPDDDNESSHAHFRNVSSELGFEYVAREPSENIVNGGVYVLDYNGDSWPDLLAIGGPDPVIFENTGGEFERTNALPDIEGTIEGAHSFDFDGNGREDLLLLARDRAPILLENTESGFVRRPAAFPVNMSYPIAAASGDYDGDGCLDVFVAQYADWVKKHPVGVHESTVSGAEDNGNPNYLFKGDCHGSFEPANGSTIRGSRWSLATSFVDFTGNGHPDIHVANDFNHDILYLNNGNGTFEAVKMGNETNRNAMSSEVGDLDGDGQLDLFVTNIYLADPINRTAGPFEGRMHGNNLLLNRGNGTFEDVAGEWGVRNGGWGWAAVLADFDNDGQEELFHTTKRMRMTSVVRSYLSERRISPDTFVSRNPEIRYPRYYERRANNEFYAARNRGFEPTSGTGVARLDFDKDGDLDLAVAQVDGQFVLYENTLSVDRTVWLQIELSGREGLPLTGAQVVVTAGDERQHRVVNSRSDFLSQDSRLVHFGFADVDRIDRVRVVWPDGSETVRENVSPDQRIHVEPTPADRE